MTPDDLKLAISLFDHGPASLIEQGMTPEQVTDFAKRTDVAQYQALLKSEATEHEALLDRTRFLTFRRLRRMADKATDVLEDALGGVKYMKHPKTGRLLLDAKDKPIINTPSPEDQQVDVAMDILDRLGVTAKAEYDPASVEGLGGLTIKATQEIHLPHVDGETEHQRVLMRDQLRGVMEQLAGMIPEIRHQHKLDVEQPVKKIKAKVITTKKRAKQVA